VPRTVRAIWKGRKAAFGAMGQINDYICLDGTIPVSQLPLVLRRMEELSKSLASTSPTCSTPATATCTR
jgi:FAD/FMN-containing dehydrogenase